MKTVVRLGLGLLVTTSSARLNAEAPRELITMEDLASTFAKVNDRRFEWASDFAGPTIDHEPPRTFGERLARGAPEVARHVGENMLVLYIVAVVAGALHEKQMAPLATDGADYSSLFVDLGQQMANNASLYVSMLGAAAAGAGGAVPVAAFEHAVEKAVGRGVVSQWFGHAAMGFVGNVGWEAGQRLWISAIGDLARGLSTADQREVARAEIKLALRLPVLKLLSGFGTAEELRVFGKVLVNAFDRLRFKDSALSRRWLADTLRLNVATGPFLTTTAAFATVGLVARTAVTQAIRFGLVGSAAGQGLPGAALGVGSALLGAAGAHLVPERVNQAVTDGLRRVHVEGTRYVLEDNRARLGVLVDHDSPDATSIAELLKDRAVTREVLGTAYFTQVYDPVTKYQSSSVLLDKACERTLDALDQKVAPLVNRFFERKYKARRRAEFFLREMLATLAKEVSDLGAVAARTRDPATRSLVAAQVEGVRASHRALRLTSVGLLPDLAAEMNVVRLDRATGARLQAEANALINLFYLNGYEEALLLPKTEAPGVAQAMH